MNILYDGNLILQWGGIIERPSAAIQISEMVEGVIDTSKISLIPISAEEINSVIKQTDIPSDSGTDICKLWALNKVKQSHAHALLTLTNSSTPEERDTWPSKTKYAELHNSACQGLTPEQIEDHGDGWGLTEDQKTNLQAALLTGETINLYLAKTLARVNAFEALAFFAEGFKRKTEKAIEAAKTIEQIDTVMTQASTDMKAAMAVFQQQLGQS